MRKKSLKPVHALLFHLSGKQPHHSGVEGFCLLLSAIQTTFHLVMEVDLCDVMCGFLKALGCPLLGAARLVNSPGPIFLGTRARALWLILISHSKKYFDFGVRKFVLHLLLQQLPLYLSESTGSILFTQHLSHELLYICGEFDESLTAMMNHYHQPKKPQTWLLMKKLPD